MNFLAGFLAAAFAAGVNGAEPRVKVLMLTGEIDAPYHDWRASAPFLRHALENTGRFEVKIDEEVRGMTAASLSPYDVLLLNYNGPRWGAGTERAIEDFVRSGKGFISFHGVTYGQFYGMVFDKRWTLPDGARGWTAYADLVGATWEPAKIGHSARHAFPVRWVDRDHPIAAGVEETFLANDELYHRLDLRPGAHVLAAAFSDPKKGGTGRDEPIVWVGNFGQGRTAHTTLGHDLSAMSQPGFVTTLARAAEWAATGSVTLPGRLAAEATKARDALRVLVVTGGHGYPSSFYTLFEGYDDIAWWHATSQKDAFNARLGSYDVVVLHDMYEDIGEAERERLKAFVEAGKGVVSIHHAIVDYTSWPWWYEEVIGGKYFTKAAPGHDASAFKEGVEFIATPTPEGAKHPVTRGIGPLPVDDELYRGMWRSPKIKVLMEVDHPLSDRPVVYIGPHSKARVIYVQLGHSDSTIRHPGYRRLVRNAVLWAGGRM